ncbi:MAG: hypothetical protein HYS05_14560 [Acidobacteria bacterium]|nr:hypothetical protein [Acidobacteriota bacterium]
MKTAEVEIHQATAAFTAGGKSYPAGSHVIKLAQPYGSFAKTMLERQVYPDLRLFPGGPPKPPYDVIGHTLGMLMGVAVESIDQPFDATLQQVRDLKPAPSTSSGQAAAPMPARPKWAYVFGPESNAGFKAVAKLQKANVPVFRAAKETQLNGKTLAPGTWIVPSGEQASRILEEVSRQTGLQVMGTDRALSVDGYRLKPGTRVGLWKAANNMPAGWLWWLFEQYDFNHQLISSKDFAGELSALSAKFDTIVLPSGTTRDRIVRGLDPRQNDKEWEWAYGVGEAGWTKLRDWVKNGGTLVAIGSATETARELLDLPIERTLPEVVRRRGGAEGSGPSPASTGSGQAGSGQVGGVQASGAAVDRALKDAFSSPARLIATLRERVVDPESLFYCPGSLLNNQFDTKHPVGFGMPAEWPVFFETDQAYRLKPGFEIPSAVVARYPEKGPILASGWLLGEDFLLDQANVVAFRVGKGYVVTLASEVDYRAQPRATFKLIFNAIFHGPSTEVSAAQLAKLAVSGTN